MQSAARRAQLSWCTAERSSLLLHNFLFFFKQNDPAAEKGFFLISAAGLSFLYLAAAQAVVISACWALPVSAVFSVWATLSVCVGPAAVIVTSATSSPTA